MIHYMAETEEQAADATGVAPDDLCESPHLLAGEPDQVADLLVERRERFGLSYVVFGGSYLEQAIPVVRRLAS